MQPNAKLCIYFFFFFFFAHQFSLMFVNLMGGPRQLFFWCSPDTLKGWTPLEAVSIICLLLSIARKREIKREQSSLLHAHMKLNHQSKVHLELSTNLEDVNPIQYIKIIWILIAINDLGWISRLHLLECIPLFFYSFFIRQQALCWNSQQGTAFAFANSISMNSFFGKTVTHGSSGEPSPQFPS